jgi:hypothetical protein
MDRFDDLLNRALETGEVPIEAMPAEREQLLAMLASASLIRSAGDDARAEASEAMPVARARFERFRAAEVAPGPVAISRPVRRRSWFAGVLAPRFIGPAAAVAAVIVVAVVAGTQLFGSGAGTALALSPGEYVQASGVVTATEDRDGATQLVVASALGDIPVSIAESTSIASESGAPIAKLKPGIRVTVGGFVGDDRRLAAQSVAVAGAGDSGPKPARLTLRELKELRPRLAGRVVVFTLAPDGSRGRVFVEGEDGRAYQVTVDAGSVQRLLELTQALGARVEVVRDGTFAPGLFSLALAGSASPTPTPVSADPSVVTTPSAAGTHTATPPTAGATPTLTPLPRPATDPALLTFRGVVTARDGNVLTVRGNGGGVATVVIRPATRILVAGSGLALEAVVRGEANVVGHQVSVTGGAEPGARRIVADVIALGPKPQQAPAGATTPREPAQR